MSIVPAGTLIPLRVFDLAVLLYNLKLALADSEIGNQDVRYSNEDHMKHMNRKTYIRADFYESALWAANMLDEKGKFKHPAGVSLKDFVGRTLNRQGYGFNKEFNWIEQKERK